MPIPQNNFPAPNDTSIAVQEIVSANPGYIVRNGTLLIFAILVLCAAAASFISYPDTLEGTAVITTNPLPIKMKSVPGGRIATLFLPDGASAPAGTPVAEIENGTGYQNILALQKVSDSLEHYLKTNDQQGLNNLLENPLSSLGDAQVFYNELLQQLSTRQLLHQEQLYKKRSQNLQQQIGQLQNISKISGGEKALIEEELRQSKERFQTNEQLYRQKIISKQEYYDEAARLRAKQLQLESQKRSSLQVAINASDNNKQMLDMQYEREDRERSLYIALEEALRNIRNYGQTWQQRYLIVAPYTGIIHYLRPLQLNEPTAAGEELFAIVPQKYQYVGIALMPATGISKVERGQEVHLLLDNYPYNEWGFLEGKVAGRSDLPQAAKEASGATYRVQISLPKKLLTNHSKALAFSPEMTATARIITKNRTLLQRLIAGISKLDK